MKKLTILAAAAAGLLGGCAVYDAPVTEGGAYYQGRGYYSGTPYYYGGDYYAYRSPYYGPYYRDRDGDGVPNRYDSRPNNPYRQ